MDQDRTELPMAALVGRAQQALFHWGLAGQTPELLKFRENAVFRIRLDDGGHAAPFGCIAPAITTTALSRPNYNGWRR